MAQYNVHEAKSNLSRLLKLVESGKEVIISRDGKPVAELVKCRARVRKKVQLGWAAGKVRETPDWDKPMSKEEAARFLGLL